MSKTTKIEDGRQQPFEQARFLTNDHVVNCDMSFLTNLGAWNPLLDLKLQKQASVTFKPHIKIKTWSVYNEYIVKKNTSGPIVTFDMSLLADCVAQNMFLVSIMSF